MPTFREDLHLGHKVPTVGSDDIVNGSITHEKLADDAVDTNNIIDRAVTEPKLADDAVSTRTIQNNAVTTPKIKDGAVTPEKLSPRVTTEVINPIVKELEKKHDGDVSNLKAKDKDLQNQIDSLTINGMAVSDQFGNDPYIGISQKALTEAFNRIWQRIDDMTGETTMGIAMTVTPEYYIGEDGCNIHISANTVDTQGIFEHIAFYWNNEETPFAEAEMVEGFEYDTEITETSVIKCVAKILGVEYTVQKIITHFDSYWLGAGNSYQAVMVNANLRPVGHHMRAAYDITANDSNRIYIILGESLADQFIRADMNGMEIAFTESTVTIDSNTYKVFASEDTYQAGTYNIDING